MLMLTWSSLFAEVGIVSTRRGVSECLDFGRERRGGDLRDHQARLQPAVPRQERRQAAQGRVDQTFGPPLADRHQLRQRHHQQIRRQRDRRAMKVAARDHVAGVGEDHGVVGGRVHLDGDHVPTQASASRAAPCTCGAHRIGVGVLHATAIGVRRVDRAAVEQPPQIVGRAACPGNGRARVDARIERAARPHQRVDRQRGGDVGGAGEALGAGQRQREHGGGRLRAVDEREAFLGPERDRRQARRRQRVGAGVGAGPSQVSPSPMSTSARWASGARSPLAPTDPRLGTRGWTCG